jgi:hypothetical protein
MGIEPQTDSPSKPKKCAVLRDSEKTACDWRANFHVIRGNVGLPETTPPFAFRFRRPDPKQLAIFSDTGRRKRGKGGLPSKKATLHIAADAIAVTPNERRDSLKTPSYVI